MIRIARLLGAGILAVGSFGCAPPPAPPPPPPAAMAAPSAATAASPTTSGVAPGQCTADSFLNRASYLTVPFSPHPGASLPPSSPLPNNPGGPNYAADLANAFNAASPEFQHQLCSLDAVFVNAVSCPTPADCFSASWGWRQSRPTTVNGRVIALSAGLWKEPSYSSYETDLTTSLLPSTGLAYSSAQSCTLAGVCRSIDTMATALLAALAHEMGHIGWYVVVDPLADPTTFCNSSFFPGSWNVPVHRPPIDQMGYPFRHLLTLAERQRLRRLFDAPDSHKAAPHVRDVDNLQPGGARNQLVYEMAAAGGPWASELAAMAPDEDFVETYKLKVLLTANPPLTSVTITVPDGGTTNIVADLLGGRRAELRKKLDCVPVTF